MADEPAYTGLYRVLGISAVRPGNVFVRTRVTRKAKKAPGEGAEGASEGKKGPAEAKKERIDIVV